MTFQTTTWSLPGIFPKKQTQLDCVAVGDSFKGGNDSPQAAATRVFYVNIASKALQFTSVDKKTRKKTVEPLEARHLPGNEKASLALLRLINAKLVAGTKDPVFTKASIAAAILLEKHDIAKKTGSSSPPSDLYPLPFPLR